MASAVTPVPEVRSVAVRAPEGPWAVSVLVGPAARVAPVVRVLTVRQGSAQRGRRDIPVVPGVPAVRAVMRGPVVFGVMAARVVLVGLVGVVAMER